MTTSRDGLWSFGEGEQALTHSHSGEVNTLSPSPGATQPHGTGHVVGLGVRPSCPLAFLLSESAVALDVCAGDLNPFLWEPQCPLADL